MPKAPLFKPDQDLETEIVRTLLAGLKQYRPDLEYPESWSDMQACVRPLLQKFEVFLRPVPARLRYQCDDCDGNGQFVTKLAKAEYKIDRCQTCNGKGYWEQ